MSDFPSRRTFLTLGASGALIGTTSVIGAAPALAAQHFADIPSRTTFYREIQWMYESGISTGWAQGGRRYYRDQWEILRDSMAAFLYRMAGSPAISGSGSFRDVGSSVIFRKEIEWLAATGISTGWADNTFRPYQPVLRDAMAAFLYRMAGSPAFSMPARSPFRDVGSSVIFRKEIAWMHATGLSTGFSDGTYRPYQPVKRGEMAAFLYRYQQKGFRTSVPMGSSSLAAWTNAVEATIFARVNEVRANAGASRVTRPSAMDKVARDWSATMGRTGTFVHNPRYSDQIPNGWSAAGENIARRSYRSSDSADAVGRALMDLWMNSPGHRENILNPLFNRIGVGVAVANGQTYATQVLARY